MLLEVVQQVAGPLLVLVVSSAVEVLDGAAEVAGGGDAGEWLQ